MKTIAQVLEGKTAPIAKMEADCTVLDALRLLAEHGIGAVLVTDAGKLAGIFSERDYARRVVLEGKSSSSTPLREVMTSKLIHVTPANTVDDAMQLMTDKRIRHLPVLDETGALVGVVSIGDMVKETIAYQQFLIRQLESYITS
ncbi:CBS domain-containing protein [Methyloversatilis sp.]|uniref:CBS domain-containing protein n=1 Tax=Methyloversatilis sp. TaxID=2569862 RepID=UPI0027348162|nr:CBS domain-containing protein [Methyloversatilis sp.]MDP2870683.1 CBS domain-containing protein [Methyloversatilis sp.]MDP3287664.1 CBS domain-containing protein [Methyloversatilis sp.]MDP3457535.1 CBS domain-containing protein [Methyloversatilis sp.]MDP3577088.1 CBS domain-containing protein [Methyloversatilis sp.]